MKGRFQRGQRFERSIGTRALIYFEGDLLPLRFRSVRHGEAHWDRHGLVFKLPCLDRGQRLLVAAQGELIALGARDAETRRQAFGPRAGELVSQWLRSARTFGTAATAIGIVLLLWGSSRLVAHTKRM